MLQQAGIGVGGSANGGMGGGYSHGHSSMEYGGKVDRQALSFCSASLPERRSILPRDTPIAERLFIVSNPEVFENKLLEDVFCRFGNMIGAYFMPGWSINLVKFQCFVFFFF